MDQRVPNLALKQVLGELRRVHLSLLEDFKPDKTSAGDHLDTIEESLVTYLLLLEQGDAGATYLNSTRIVIARFLCCQADDQKNMSPKSWIGPYAAKRVRLLARELLDVCFNEIERQ